MNCIKAALIIDAAWHILIDERATGLVFRYTTRFKLKQAER